MDVKVRHMMSTTVENLQSGAACHACSMLHALRRPCHWPVFTLLFISPLVQTGCVVRCVCECD